MTRRFGEPAEVVDLAEPCAILDMLAGTNRIEAKTDRAWLDWRRVDRFRNQIDQRWHPGTQTWLVRFETCAVSEGAMR